MAVLHLLSRSPDESPAWEQCLARAGEGDALLLLDNAVYAAVTESTPVDLPVFVLASGLCARGLSEAILPEGVRPIDYAGFVELTEHYPLTLSWF